MSAFNTEHIPVGEMDALGPDLGTATWYRYHLVFACGKAVSRYDESNYTPAKNRKRCRWCLLSIEQGKAVAMERPRGGWGVVRHTRLGEGERPGTFLLACGAQGRDEHADREDGEQHRLCPGCREAGDQETDRAELRRERLAGTAREVYRAIKTAVSGPDPRPLVYDVQAGRPGFYRPDRPGPRGKPQGDRIMEDASSLMNMAALSCPQALRDCLRYEDGYMTARMTDEAASQHHFGITPGRVGAGMYSGTHWGTGRSAPPDPGPRRELSDTVERLKAQIDEKIPEAREHAWQVMERALEPFGFTLEEHGENARRLVSPMREAETRQTE